MSTVASPTSVASTESDTDELYTPSLSEVAVALTFRQTLETFLDVQPEKMKWSNLSQSGVCKFTHYNIIKRAPCDMGKGTIWVLADWVDRLLSRTDDYLNFSTEQIYQLADYESFLTSFDDTFTYSDTEIHTRTLGYLNRLNLIEKEEDLHNYHDVQTVWARTDRLEKVYEIREVVDDV